MNEAVFELLWKMSGCAAGIVIDVFCIRLLMKKAPKVWSYALWALVLLRLICPVFPEAQISRIGEDASAVVELDVVLTDSAAPGEAVRPDGDTVPMEPSGGTAVEAEPELWERVYQVWPYGVAAMALYAVISLLCLKRKLRFAVPLRENIYIVDHIDTPFVVGVFRPRIYLPSELDPARVEHIIRHEQHHIRRWDPLIKAAAFVVLSVYWFRPLLWAAYFLMCRDMEMSCDEAVMKQMEGDIRADYAESLLRLSTSRRRIAPTPLAFGEGNPKTRIRNVLNYRTPRFWVNAVAVVVLIAMGACYLTDPVYASTGVKEIGIYRPGKLVAQSAVVSDSPEDGSLYRQIMVHGDGLSVMGEDYDWRYYCFSGSGSARWSEQTFDRAELSDYLYHNWTKPKGWFEAYDPDEVTVWQYFEDESKEKTAYSLYFFDGELTWFAEGVCDRIYEVEPIDDGGAFDAAVSPWQWTSNVTPELITVANMCYWGEDWSDYTVRRSRDMTREEIATLVSILNEVPREHVKYGKDTDAEFSIMITCGTTGYLLNCEDGIVRIIMGTHSPYLQRCWYIEDPALNALLDSLIADLTAQ